MRPPSFRTLFITGFVLLTALPPSGAIFELVAGYFLTNSLSKTTTNIWNRVSQAILKPTSGVVFGGGTHIVTQALTHDYIPGLRRAVWNGITGALSSGITGLGSLGLNGFWGVIKAILGIVAEIVGGIIAGSIGLQTQLIWSATSIIAGALTALYPQDEGISTSFEVAEFPGIDTPLVRLLRGRREVRSSVDHLRDVFVDASKHDHLGCLQLVLCAIHADPEELVTPYESAFRRIFKPLFAKEPSIPSWAKNYVEASDLGSNSASSKVCQNTYSSCSYSDGFLRKYINEALHKTLVKR